jgi:FkbM family methyltransferase
MKQALKALVRELTPPILYRGLQAIAGNRAQKPSTEFVVEEFGRTLRHRGSSADVQVLQQVFLLREYGFERLKRLPEIQAFHDQCDAPLIVDCGANIGASAVWFGCHFPRARIVALEPEQDNFRLLRENTAGLRVDLVQGAIAAHPGELDLFDPGDGEWAYRTVGTEGKRLSTVRAYDLRELVALAAGSTPFILKIDVEGAEDGLFDRDPETFARFPIVIVELHDWMLPGMGTSTSFIRWHLGQDRDLAVRGENLFSLSNTLLPWSASRQGTASRDSDDRTGHAADQAVEVARIGAAPPRPGAA